MNTQELQTGDVIGTYYTIIKKLGNGAYGHTYLATNAQNLDQNCVVKHLHPNTSDPDELQLCQQLFKREAETLQKLARNNPNIPLLTAYFEENSEFYLVQEYIEGHTLTNELKSGQKLPEEEVIELITELLEIVAYLHNNDVIHRDIKPENIMRRSPLTPLSKMGSRGDLILIDFGAVKQVTSQNQKGFTIIGTPGYMPIEQSQGNTQYSSDIYAVGIIAIKALTGLNSSVISQQIETGKFNLKKEVNISNNFAEIINKMTDRDYQKRFITAQEALDAIKVIQKTLPPNVHVAPTIKLSNPRSNPRNKIVLIGIISTLLLALISLFVIKNNSVNDLLIDGKIITGELNDSDSIHALNNSYKDEYIFKGKAEKTVQFNLDSEEFDPVLSIYLDGKRIAINNDIAPDNFNSEIIITLPKNANYKVVVSSNNPGETGSYTLTAKIR
jgi:serine/threonine protein kinase